MSIQNSRPQFDREGNVRIPRFSRLDEDHIQAIATVVQRLPQRFEVHLPGHRAKQIFEREKLLVWAKFDRRPTCLLLFIDGFAPALWDPSRQEGLTFRWILPPGFGLKGPTVCLANLLKGESVLQIEDLVVYEGTDLWSSQTFTSRWNQLRHFWNRLPPDQPLIAVKPRIVEPLSIASWSTHYDNSLSWIIQPDTAGSQRFYWWDSVTPKNDTAYRTPVLNRSPDIQILLCALAKPYAKIGLPDAYSLEAEAGKHIGIASISTMALSQEMRAKSKDVPEGLKVEVKWNDEFEKYQIVKILEQRTPISAASFFRSA